MRYLIAILGVLVVFGLTYAVSSHRRNIRYRPLFFMFVLQAVLAFALLHTVVGELLIGGFASIFEKLLSYA
ncbi:NupC/NupG family nucleoside CNT transporter, partial [Bacillus cereus]|nr:NupC/NupG family nucleoside CNT transporter [Bacillus cereus]